MQPVPFGPLRTFRILAGALMGALVVIGVALSFVVGNTTTDRGGHTTHNHAPHAWVYIVIVVVGVAAALLVQAVGYRLPALKPGLPSADARKIALTTYQQTMFLRFGLSEVVALVSIALLFTARSNTILPYVVGAVISELLLAYHVWPGERLIARVQQRLERDGGRSELPEALNGVA